MLLDKHVKKEKELRSIRTELDKLQRFGTWGRKERFVIEWVPLEPKEFLGWEVKPNIKPGYHPHEEVVNHILQYLTRPYILRDETLISRMRNFKHSVSKIKTFLYKNLKWSWIKNKHPLLEVIPKFELNKYDYDSMVKECPIELRHILRSFFLIEMKSSGVWRSHEKIPYYVLKVSNDTTSSYEFPLPLVYYTFHKIYISEIGLIDGNYIAKYDKLYHKAYSDYKYISAWNYVYRDRWDYGDKEKNRSSYRNFSKSLLKLDTIDEDTVLEEASKQKFFKNRNKQYKWSF
jgi:hypothetical protein